MIDDVIEIFLLRKAKRMSKANGVTVPVESSVVMSDDNGTQLAASHGAVSSYSYEAGDRVSSSAHGNSEYGAVEDSTTHLPPYQEINEHRSMQQSKGHMPHPSDVMRQYGNSFSGGGGDFGDSYLSQEPMVPPPSDISRTYRPPPPQQQYPMMFNQSPLQSSAAPQYAYPVGVPVLHNSPPMMMMQYLPGQPIPHYTDLESTHGGLHMPWQQKAHVPGRQSNQSGVQFDPGPPIQLTPDEHGPEGCNLFVFHLPNELSNVELYYSFVPFGTVISAKIMIDNSTGRSRGFGFVSFNHQASAGNAILRMNGVQMGNKRLKVQLKKEKPKGGRIAPADYGSGRDHGSGGRKGKGKGGFQPVTAARRRSRGRNRGRSTLDQQASERGDDAEIDDPADARSAAAESINYRDEVELHQDNEGCTSEKFAALAIVDDGSDQVAREKK